jgi:CelD/BcsL family acetyltransferase involved in cellulose biosynthesis
MLSVRRIDDLAGLTALGPTWLDLLGRCSNRNLFLTYDWTRTWWEFFGEDSDLWMLVVSDGNEIVGIAPMMLHRETHGGVPVRVLGSITNRHVSRSDFVVPARREEVFRALVEYWQDVSSQWDLLRLTGVPEESGTTRLLIESISGGGLRVFPIEAHKELCYLPVSGSWEEYVARRSHNFQRNYVRLGNRLDELHAVSFDFDDSPASVDESMSRLFALESTGAKSVPQRTELDDNEKRFHRALAARFAAHGGFQNRFIVADGVTIAGLHSIAYDGVLYALLTFYDVQYSKVSPGRAVLRHALAASWQDTGIRRIDLNGSSPFLRTWTNHSVKLERLAIGNQRGYSRLMAWFRHVRKTLAR